MAEDYRRMSDARILALRRQRDMACVVLCAEMDSPLPVAYPDGHRKLVVLPRGCQDERLPR